LFLLICMYILVFYDLFIDIHTTSVITHCFRLRWHLYINTFYMKRFSPELVHVATSTWHRKGKVILLKSFENCLWIKAVLNFKYKHSIQCLISGNLQQNILYKHFPLLYFSIHTTQFNFNTCQILEHLYAGLQYGSLDAWAPPICHPSKKCFQDMNRCLKMLLIQL